MGRESTLDEFGRDDGSSDAEAPGATGVPEDSSDADAPDSADPDAPPEDADAARSPAPVTCEWTPDGAACEACGATVERRWVDGAARVCADCKEW